jgi:opacity protein-like surface antigen
MIRVVFTVFALIILTEVHHPPDVYAGDFEITPLFGYTFGGEFEDSVTGTDLEIDASESYGLILGLKSTDNSQYEFYYSHQPMELQTDGGAFTGDPLFDVDINYFHIGGSYGKESGKVKPYVAGGLGVTYMNPGRGDSETSFSMSLGGGIKVYFTDHIGIRLEGRGFGTFLSGSREVFCVGNICAVRTSGDAFWQFSALSGLIVAF